ncbi:MAG: Ig domain-containing protein [Isosphaeraceae bacterium]|nr:Ig domain-containing protein [Isosphaeraceae bacterium]
MRHSRRNGHGGMEFGGSGEDSFVAVVVTKLTGALLFILLLTMVIMALIPKAVDLPQASSGTKAESAAAPLAIATPEALPEAIAGRPYTLALAATGGRGPLKWSVDGQLPEGLEFDPASARLQGTPTKGTPTPVTLTVRVSDGTDRATQSTRLVVYQSDAPLTTPAWWKPGIPPIPWRAWLEQGFGFLLLWLVHLIAMNTLSNLERWSLSALDAEPAPNDADAVAVRRRFRLYRITVRVATLAATAALAAWLVSQHT